MLLMDALLALSIDAAAPREHERIAADHRDGEVVKADRTGATGMGGVGAEAPAPPVLTASWNLVKGEDWEGRSLGWLSSSLSVLCVRPSSTYAAGPAGVPLFLRSLSFP